MFGPKAAVFPTEVKLVFQLFFFFSVYFIGTQTQILNIVFYIRKVTQ